MPPGVDGTLTDTRHGLCRRARPHGARTLGDTEKIVGSTQLTPSMAALSAYQLRFVSLFQTGRALSFPCDASGCVDLDALSERARANYLYARAMVGRDYARPSQCSPA